jgi:hypothetical protein
VDDSDSEGILRRRVELEQEHKRLVKVYTKGYITEPELDEKVERIRSKLFELPIPEVRDPVKATQEALSAGETLGRMADYWREATPEERRDMVWSLLNA